MARTRIPDEHGMLLCIECGETKHLREFYLTGRKSKGVDTYFSYCSPCHSTRTRKRSRGEELSDHRRVSQADAQEIYCSSCDQTLPRTAFSFRTKGRQVGQPYLPCKDCKNRKHREYLAANPHVKKRHRKPAHAQDYYLKKYGLTRESFEALLVAQDWRCAICPAVFRGDDAVTPAIDHCHQSGAVRGVLCRECNSALGLLKDSADYAARAAEYLRATAV
jgi:hypothetical protein